MNTTAILAWGLAALAIAVGYVQWGWRGVLLGVTVVAFWLLLQFSRLMRAMRLAGQAPVGRVPSAVMLHARLQRGMRLVDIIQLTRSLGEPRGDAPERFAWRDDSGAEVVVELVAGRCTAWTLARGAGQDGSPDPGGPGDQGPRDAQDRQGGPAAA